MTGPKAGYKGKVKIGSVTIAALGEFTVTPGERTFEDRGYFGDEHEAGEALKGTPTTVTLTGKYLVSEDEGQQLLQTLYKLKTKVYNLELYIDEDEVEYLGCDSTTTPPTYAIVAKLPDITHVHAGIATFSVTFRVFGDIVPNSTTTSVAVETHGAIDVADITATLLGELVSIGEEASVDAYFEYGETTSYGSDTSGSKTTMTLIGLFDNDLTGLSSGTLHHARAVIELSDTSKVYGKDIEFTTAS